MAKGDHPNQAAFGPGAGGGGRSVVKVFRVAGIVAGALAAIGGVIALGYGVQKAWATASVATSTTVDDAVKRANQLLVDIGKKQTEMKQQEETFKERQKALEETYKRLEAQRNEVETKQGEIKTWLDHIGPRVKEMNPQRVASILDAIAKAEPDGKNIAEAAAKLTRLFQITDRGVTVEGDWVIVKGELNVKKAIKVFDNDDKERIRVWDDGHAKINMFSDDPNKTAEYTFWRDGQFGTPHTQTQELKNRKL